MSDPRGIGPFGRKHQIVIPAVSGVARYVVPVMNCFLDDVADSTLEIDKGSGFITQVHGVGYLHFGRTSTPGTVSDLAIGFALIGPNASVSAGWSLRFTFISRHMSYPAPQITKVRINAGSIDFALKWKPSDPAVAPNGIVSSGNDGCCLEFWRMVRGPGGGSTASRRVKGRFVPWYRAAVDTWVVPSSLLNASNKRRVFKVCYYDPVTKSRSAFCQEKIVVNGGRTDQCSGGSRAAGSTWLK